MKSYRMASVVLALVSMTVSALAAAEKPKKKALTPAQQQATDQIREYFRRSTAQLSERALADISSLEDWQQRRPQLRRQLLDMLGLWPMPEKTDLKATTTGIVDKGDFVVEKLHYQSLPGLYVTGSFYRPKTVDKPLPTILYVCGHGRVKVDGVSYGNKATYQHHGAWFAREGYCCLIIDTVQLGEIEGIHHGTYRHGMWWWIARGYTPAGVEAWNSVRALDYLQTRPEVDAARIGVTGRSGGGIYTWWLAAIDDRPACLVPVAGITDLQNYVVDNCIEGHCDCMFMVNTYGWDFPMVAALAAPRPLLFSNSDKDRIFPLDGVVRTHAKIKRIYDLYGAADKLGLLITEGPHRDTQELRVPAFRWMNRWLKKTDEPITRLAQKLCTPQELKVFDQLPADQRNTEIQESFVPQATLEIPSDLATWNEQRRKLLQTIRTKSLPGWPDTPPAAECAVTEETSQGLELRAFEYTSDENLRLSAFVVQPAGLTEPKRLFITVIDNDGWREWLATFGNVFPNGLPGAQEVPADARLLAGKRRLLEEGSQALAVVLPRGVGPHQWDPNERADTHIRRRFVLVGKTADEGRIWDVRRAIAVLRADKSFAKTPLCLQGQGTSAGLALYAGLFEPAVEQFELHRPTTTHRDGPILMNILRCLDMPQAVALAFPRRVTLCETDPKAWQWSQAVAKLYDANQPPLRLKDPLKDAKDQ